jgi:hypothetical protein
VGLVRTLFSNYWRLRSRLGLTRYARGAMIEKLNAAGFGAELAPANIGHNPARRTYYARPRRVRAGSVVVAATLAAPIRVASSAPTQRIRATNLAAGGSGTPPMRRFWRCMGVGMLTCLALSIVAIVLTQGPSPALAQASGGNGGGVPPAGVAGGAGGTGFAGTAGGNGGTDTVDTGGGGGGAAGGGTGGSGGAASGGTAAPGGTGGTALSPNGAPGSNGSTRPRTHKSTGRSAGQSPLCPDNDQIARRGEMS